MAGEDILCSVTVTLVCARVCVVTRMVCRRDRRACVCRVVVRGRGARTWLARSTSLEQSGCRASIAARRAALAEPLVGALPTFGNGSQPVGLPCEPDVLRSLPLPRFCAAGASPRATCSPSLAARSRAPLRAWPAVGAWARRAAAGFLLPRGPPREVLRARPANPSLSSVVCPLVPCAWSARLGARRLAPTSRQADERAVSRIVRP